MAKISLNVKHPRTGNRQVEVELFREKEISAQKVSRWIEMSRLSDQGEVKYDICCPACGETRGKVQVAAVKES